ISVAEQKIPWTKEYDDDNCEISGVSFECGERESVKEGRKMSFSFFKARSKSPSEVSRAIKESLLALDTKTAVDVKALEKALEEVEKNFSTMRYMLCGDAESEPNPDQVSQFALELCKDDVLTLLVHALSLLGWQARKDLVHCWAILLKQQVDSKHCCVDYLESHLQLLDFLAVCLDFVWDSYDNKDVALTGGSMLRECIKFPKLAKYILESACFEFFFKYVELPVFDVASDAFTTFKDLLTRHVKEVSEYLTSHYDEFFPMYEKLLTSANYVTRRQSLKLLTDFLLEPPNSRLMKQFILEIRYLKVIMMLLKDSSKNIQISAFHIFKVFVANPHKSKEIKLIIAKNHDKLIDLLGTLSVGKGAEDEQFEEEKDVIVNEIEKVYRTANS
ncbi:hypothetical protein V2J09_023132, partial [Rumex salicifolius]